MKTPHWLHSILAIFDKAEHDIYDFLAPIVKSTEKDLLAQALPIGLNIVKNLATGKGGVATRDQATAQLKDQMVKQGIAGSTTIGGDVLNWVVETALRHLRVTLG